MLTENVKVLVTGASSGIGLGICQVLTKHGARVIGTGRNREALLKLKNDGDIEDFIVADLACPASSVEEVSPCKHTVDTAAILLGGLTAVVNAAGVIRTGAMGDVDVENYDFHMNTNTRVSFEIMTHSIPYLKEAAAEAKSGERPCTPSIVNISSVNGKQSFPGCVSYCLSKAAVDMMTRCSSVDLAKFGVRVNAVNPGMVVTNLHKRSGLSDDQYESFLKRQIEVTHPLGAFLGRCGTPAEVGELVSFLISERAQFVTGECVAMDGGRQNLGMR